MRFIWTKEMIQIEALKYEGRHEFKKGSNKACQAAQRLNIMDEVCSHMEAKQISWTKEMIHAEALKYDYRREFQDGSRNAHAGAASRLNILDEVCSHMEAKRISWTKEMIHAEALKYEGRLEFQLGSSKAYSVAQTRGIIDEVCSHMEYAEGASDNDTVYLWKMKHSKRKYKLGVSSWRLYHQRIIQVAQSHNTDYEIFAMVQVPNAANIETELLNTYLAKPKNIKKLDGHTEFRVLNDTEVREILEYLFQEAIDIDGNDFRFDLIGMAA